MKPLRSLFLAPFFWITFFIVLSYTSYAQVENDTLLASQYYKTADSLLIDRKLDSSLVYFQKALPLYEKAETWERVAACYNGISKTQRLNSSFKKSLESATNALKTCDTYLSQNSREKIDAYSNMVEYYYIISDFNMSIYYCQKALDIKLRVLPKNHSDIASSYNDLGVFNTQINEFIKGRYYFEKALIIRKKNLGENHKKIGNTYNNLGLLSKKLGDYKEALSYYKKDLLVLLNTSDKTNNSVGESYINIGSLYNEYFEFDKALEYTNKALRIFTLNDYSYGIAASYNNIGISHEKKQNYKKAIFFFNKALTTSSSIKNAKPLNAQLINNIGSANFFLKKYQKAIDYKKRALTIWYEIYGENHSKVAGSYSDIGMIYAKNKNYNKALENYHKALRIRQKLLGETNFLLATEYNNFGEVYKEKKEFKTALLWYQKALDVNLKKEVIDHDLIENSYKSLKLSLHSLTGQALAQAMLYQHNNIIDDLHNSILNYQQADTIINTIRQTFTNYQDKVEFAKQAKEIYQGAITAQLLLKNQQSLEKAFYYAEKSKANTLKELLNVSNAKNFTGLPQNLVALEKELRINKAFYQSKITEEYADKDTDTTRITFFENKLFDINRRQDSLTQILEKNYPKYYQLKYQNKIVSVKDIQQQLDDKTTVLEFFTGDSITYAFTISKNNIAVQELSTPKLTEQVEEFRKTIADKNTADFKEQAHGLYNQLIAPVANTFVGDNLIIIPDGSLWHLNSELLLTQHDKSNNPALLSYLLRDYAVTYANSANLLFGGTKQQEQTEQLQECLAFSFSDSRQTGETRTMSLAALRNAGGDLPGTRKEIKAISNIIDGQYYYGSQAIEANFKKNAGQYNILHLALHGKVDNERPENSKLYFTKNKDTIEDNLLYSHELFALNIPAELTVLSACNTGTGKIAKGEGIMSLGTAFQYAGTKSLLLTSWEVSDQTTPELMKYFYTNLKDGMSKPKALQQAKLQYLTTADINRLDPFYWGAFYLVGDAAPIPFESNTLLYWGIGGLTLLLLAGLFWYRKKVRGRMSEV
ncbi:CHAT domain-containing protein [Aquimarina sediminis]|uniref:CHAT domain-containing protein n=1 Tax=Aquimarina sediminis TaxID=2070536 RepID=UPI000CA06A14|nr:CHAT domain-containing tetratricopeptide repeat protein [Aquimarina sediminis]